MTKPSWQDWPEEPWSQPSATHRDFGEPVFHSEESHFDDGRVGRYTLDSEMSQYERALACVNACAGIRNPAALREVVEAASKCHLLEKYAGWQRELGEALAKLDEGPTP